MSEVRVHDHTETLQLVKVAIHRREMNVGRQHLHTGSELLGGSVSRVLEETQEQQAPRGGHSATVCPEKVEHILDGAQRRVASNLSGTRHDLIISDLSIAPSSLLQISRTIGQSGRPRRVSRNPDDRAR
jgi:hypothetical protein